MNLLCWIRGGLRRAQILLSRDTLCMGFPIRRNPWIWYRCWYLRKTSYLVLHRRSSHREFRTLWCSTTNSLRMLCLLITSSHSCLCGTWPLHAHYLEEVLLRRRRCRLGTHLHLLCLLLYRLLEWGHLCRLHVLDISSYVYKRLFPFEPSLKVHFYLKLNIN